MIIKEADVNKIEQLYYYFKWNSIEEYQLKLSNTHPWHGFLSSIPLWLVYKKGGRTKFYYKFHIMYIGNKTSKIVKLKFPWWHNNYWTSLKAGSDLSRRYFWTLCRHRYFLWQVAKSFFSIPGFSIQGNNT